ncbi:MAG: hypothetical protein ABSC23_18465 [Bryobacteraceae bacterium]
MPPIGGIDLRCARRPLARVLFLVLLAVILINTPLLGAESDKTLVWREGTPYSDRLLYNGFAYKTIRVFDEHDPSLSLSVAVSPGQESCPGRMGKCLTAIVIVTNEGTARFDVQPEEFECRCNNKKHQIFSQYKIPDYLKRVAPPGTLFTANTATPGKTVQGIVYFNGSCADYVVAIPVDVPERGKLIFEFPLASGTR